MPLPIDHVDTDQIIPARFLKATTREGFGANLFRDWRFRSDGTVIEDFVLNRDEYQGEILLTGQNFGSGSSREHAAWAIKDYGFRVVLSTRFADIFRNNALNNGLLPVELPASFSETLFQAVEGNPNLRIEVNLPDQIVQILPDGPIASFSINAYKKHCLLNGLDDMDYLLSEQQAILNYEAAHNK